MAAPNSRVFVNGVEFPGAAFRLEVHPVRRLVLTQPFPPKLSFGRFVDLSPEAQGENIVTVEVRSKPTDAFLLSCTGHISAFYIFYDIEHGRGVDKEYLEISCDSIQYKEA